MLLAYAKMSLYDELLASDLPDDPQLVDDLLRYFPRGAARALRGAIERHRLRREIIATVVTNDLVNRAGSPSSHEMRARTGRAAADIARAFASCRDVFELPPLWTEIEALDNKVAGGACRSRC